MEFEQSFSFLFSFLNELQSNKGINGKMQGDSKRLLCQPHAVLGLWCIHQKESGKHAVIFYKTLLSRSFFTILYYLERIKELTNNMTAYPNQKIKNAKTAMVLFLICLHIILSSLQRYINQQSLTWQVYLTAQTKVHRRWMNQYFIGRLKTGNHPDKLEQVFLYLW